MAYAGKLSERGQLIDDFRCYVTGCTQTNKRRDHMMVHVGAHVDQRPFACSSCPMHFLRRNECKRHEASHTGSKPFTCHLCSRYDNKSFARQDLLKRHLNRAHGFDTSANKENVPARKKSRVE
ncbi:hypothetical protein PLICRDRAFT_129799 [Plicaturopsis crispa FD-325 SS-3]|nr:hypothetical protein PLICRDRAFT_129799 [Plicaturopsis crispa FD-325 SS-3]